MTHSSKGNKTVIIPLPLNDFDPTEVAIPWKILCESGVKVFFATPDGAAPQADNMMLTGEGLDPWGWIPFIKKIRLIGLMLRADKHARRAYQALLQDPHFQSPYKYKTLKVDDEVSSNGLTIKIKHFEYGHIDPITDVENLYKKRIEEFPELESVLTYIEQEFIHLEKLKYNEIAKERLKKLISLIFIIL